MAISETLGGERELTIPAGTIRYREQGSGPVLVFVHGVLVNGDLWRKVVPRLADDYRCVTPDWPLGSHSVAVRRDTDLSPPGLAQVILDFLEALGEDDVTLVSNDTGTALTQLVLARQPRRVARAVLVHGDAFSHFFPPVFRWLPVLGKVPGALRLAGLAMGPTFVKRLGYLALSKSLREPAILDSYADPARRDAGVRRDTRRVLSGVRARYTLDAASRLPRFTGPVLVVWGRADRVFPLSLGERLAKLFPNGELATIVGTRTFVPEDQPEALVEAMRGFLARTDPEREAPSAATAGAAS